MSDEEDEQRPDGQRSLERGATRQKYLGETSVKVRIP